MFLPLSYSLAEDPDGPSGVTLAEFVAAMSLAVDLGMGLPTEHVLRQTVIALRLAESEDFSEEQRSALYYVSLLAWIGCAADSDFSAWFGDETAFFARQYEVDMAGLPMAAFVTRQIGRGQSSLRRLALLGRFLATGGRAVEDVLQTHCLSAGHLAGRLGLGDEVRDPLLPAFERWDGKGTPGQVREESLAPTIRRRKWRGGFGTKREAITALNDILARIGDGTYVEPRKMRFSEYLPEWLSGLRTQVRPSTWESYERNIRAHVIPNIGHYFLHELTPQTPEIMYADLQLSGMKGNRAKGSGLSARSVAYVHTILHRALSNAVRKGMLAVTSLRPPTRRR